MALEMKVALKMSQQLVMTPQLQQAIKLLQLNHVELAEHIAEEMVENPALEESAEGADAEEAPVQPESPTAQDGDESGDVADPRTDDFLACPVSWML